MTHIRQFISIVAFLLFLVPCLYAEKARLLSPDDGLSNSHISQIYQDSQGYIWIATDNGLNKFNGYNFTVYSEQLNDSTSLRGNFVYTLLEDSRGTFWVGTMGGLLQYDRKKDTFQPFLIEADVPFYMDRVIWMLEDKRGNIWLSHPGTGIICLDAETRKPVFFNKNNSALEDNNINCAYEDHLGNLWLGTPENGVYVYNVDNHTFQHFYHNPSDAGSLNNDRTLSICEDPHQNILIGTFGGGINIFDRETKKFKAIKTGNTLQENQIYSICYDRAGTLWLGTDGAGIIRFDSNGNKLPQLDGISNTFNLDYSKVHQIFEDRQGNMWLALYQKGILFIPSTHKAFENYGYNTFDPLHDIGSNCVISILEDSFDNLWIGTDGDGLYRINRENQTITHFTPTNTKDMPGGSVITALFEDKDKNIWIGTYVGGMFRYNRTTGRFDSHYKRTGSTDGISNDHVTCFVQDKNGDLWIGMNGGGFNHFNMKTKEFKHYWYDENKTENQLSSNWVYTMYIDPDGNFWIGTSQGVDYFDPETERFLKYGMKEGTLYMDIIYALNPDHEGNIWVGGFFGLYRIDYKTRDVIHITTLDGLPDNMINGIEEDENHYLWLSTGKGLCRFDPETKKCLNFYVEDGLQGNEFRRGSYYKGKNDRMYFGGINGMTTFIPSLLVYRYSLLRLAFTDLLIYNEPVSVKSGILENSLDESQSIHLKYNQRSFTFRFAALEYSVPHRVLYYTQMENFDKQWRLINSPNRSITYTNLDPGKYIFKVKATLDDENFLEREFMVVIEPPFWLSVWAKIFYTLLILGLAYTVYAYLKYRMKQSRILMEKEQQKQLSESKLQFFTDISHEIRTPLTLIIAPIEKLMEDPIDNKMRPTYNIIHQNALRILRLINQLMDLRAVEKGKLKLKVELTPILDFTSKIMDSFKNLATDRQIDFSLVVENNLPDVYIDRDCLDKVIFNLLSNAFKFTPDRGYITVYLATKADQLEIRVEDTGIGISKENQEIIFERFYQVREAKMITKMGTGIGLHLTKMMLNLHHGSIEVESELEKGARFTVHLPLSKNAYTLEEFGVTHAETPATMIQPSVFQLVSQKTEEKKDMELKSGKNSGHSLLIVEDDIDILNYIQSEMSHNYLVYTATNGREGLTMALKYMPDVIVSDIVMPEMDGLMLCKLIKSNDKTCDIPVILLTAKTSVEQRIEGLDMGADSYIPKPFSMKHLETRVGKLIQLREKLKYKYTGEMEKQLKDVEIISSDEKLLRKFNEKVKEQISNPELSVESISKELGLSRVHLNRRLKTMINDSPGNYIRNYRLKQAAWLLINKKMTIAEVAYAVGFSSHAYFSNIFKERFGMSPTEYIETNITQD